MSELISGKEALIALANGEDVQYKFPDGTWMDFTTNLNLRGSGLKVVDFLNDYAEFHLKPRTITINGIEVPAPFKPKEDCIVFIIDDGKTCNYRQYDYEFGAEDESNWIGIWRTEEEIKQVVAALRSVFKGE